MLAVVTRAPKRRPLPSMHDIVVPDGRRSEEIGPSGCAEHPDRATELLVCERSFPHFLPHWMFINRENGDVLTFESLWDGQARIVGAMDEHEQLIILKAGKLGASELECAFDGWRSRFGGANTRVHIFSMDRLSAISMLDIVKFGLAHMPGYMQLPVSTDAGGDIQTQVIYRGGRDDERKIITYAPTKHAAIDASAMHTHVDELARMPFPEATWSAVSSTIAPDGTVHIVSRGQGAQNYLTTLWGTAQEPEATLHPIFEAWDARPRKPEGAGMIARVERGEIDAAAAWYAEQANKMPTTSQLWYFAPMTADQALAGAAEDAFIDIARWDACYDPTLPALLPGDPTPVVLSLDAGVTNDVFAATLVSRNPANPQQAALRAYRAWVPAQDGTEVDFDEVEMWVRTLCLGGCVLMHPNAAGGVLSDGQICSIHSDKHFPHRGCAGPGVPCPACAEGRRQERLNVVQIVNDRYELRDMIQRLTRDRVAWCEPMDQGNERTEADTTLKTLLLQRDMGHHIDPADTANLMRLHVQGAKGKVPAGDDNRVRIEKAHAKAKVDLLVSLSMAVTRCLYLNLASHAT